jgi:hypothetical protein
LPGTANGLAVSSRVWPLAAGTVYLLAFLALFHVAGLFEIMPGVSTWYPAAGLRLAALLLFGWRFGLVIAIAETVAGMILGATGLSAWDTRALTSPERLAGMVTQGWIPSVFYGIAA